MKFHVPRSGGSVVERHQANNWIVAYVFLLCYILVNIFFKNIACFSSTAYFDKTKFQYTRRSTDTVTPTL